jgi:hypothetical protein
LYALLLLLSEVKGGTPRESAESGKKSP